MKAKYIRNHKIGEKIGDLEIIEIIYKNGSQNKWKCKCICGKEIIMDSAHLHGNYKKNCGCKVGKTTFRDLTGYRSGKLTVLGIGTRNSRGNILWKCLCDCGNTILIPTGHLTSKNPKWITKSCKVRGMHSRIGEGNASFNNFYKSYKDGAKKRGLEFSLSKEVARSISQENCFYCGEIPSNRVRGDSIGVVGDFIYNGLDRVDNSLGYTINNVVPCCTKCNRAKDIQSLEEFKSWIGRIYKHWVSS